MLIECFTRPVGKERTKEREAWCTARRDAWNSKCNNHNVFAEEPIGCDSWGEFHMLDEFFSMMCIILCWTYSLSGMSPPLLEESISLSLGFLCHQGEKSPLWESVSLLSRFMSSVWIFLCSVNLAPSRWINFLHGEGSLLDDYIFRQREYGIP